MPYHEMTRAEYLTHQGIRLDIGNPNRPGLSWTPEEIAAELARALKALRETGQAVVGKAPSVAVLVKQAGSAWQLTLRDHTGEVTEKERNLTKRESMAWARMFIENALEPFLGYQEYLERNHWGEVRAALREGLHVPARVLADYPELAGGG